MRQNGRQTLMSKALGRRAAAAALLLASALIAAFAAPVTADGPTRVSEPGAYHGYDTPEYDEWVRSSQYVEVRDGTRLAVDLYRPAVDGVAVDTPHPVVWEHQLRRAETRPDGSVRLRRAELASELTRYGYVVAVVDRRGRGASYGTMTGYHSRAEARDAYDITEWLATQPWSDGNIGVFGCSNTGEAAMHAATEAPPSLKAVFAGNFSFHKYDGFLRGGIRANWGTGPDRPYTDDLVTLPVDEDHDGSMLEEAVEEHRDNTSLYEMWRDVPYRDSYSSLVETTPWQEYSVATYRERIEDSGVAVYGWDGWRDDFRREVLVADAALANPGKVLIGPWPHCGSEGFDLMAEQRRFFDHTLKGIPNGILDEPPIRYYTTGAVAGDRWRWSWSWPLPNENRDQWFLAGGHSGTVGSVNDGTFSREPSNEADATDQYQVDYSVSCAVELPPWRMEPCVHDEQGLTYTSEPLAEPMEVTGHPAVELWIESEATEGNFFAYLEDVAPDGTVDVVTDGRLRASLREVGDPGYEYLDLPWHRSYEQDARPLEAGEPALLEFDMLPLSHVFREGHRVRLTVTGADPREADRAELSPPPSVTLHRNRTHPSSISLPVTTRPVEATVEIRPESLQLRSRGRFTVFADLPGELPDGYRVPDIDLSTIRLDGVEPDSVRVAGHRLVAKFAREDFAGLPGGETVSLRLTGEFRFGIPFAGTGTVRTRG